MITILYFASLREQLNLDREQLDRPDGVSTVGDLRKWLCRRGAPWSVLLAEESLVMMSLNHAMTDTEATISDGDEIAFFPPVTGG